MLNLMPCVLPVLSLKLLALLGHTGTERRIARLGLFATAAGIVTSFGVLAAVLIVLKATGAAIGWGIQFQQPWFLAVMALVTTLFAASMWDWLPFALPGSVAGQLDPCVGAAASVMRFCWAPSRPCSPRRAQHRSSARRWVSHWRADRSISRLCSAPWGFGMAAPFLAVAAAPVWWRGFRGQDRGWAAPACARTGTARHRGLVAFGPRARSRSPRR